MHLLFRLFGRLPLRLVHWLGSALGWGAYAVDPVYRRRLRENLDASGIAATPAALTRLRREAIVQLGRTVAEMPSLWFQPPTTVACWVRSIDGRECIDEAHARGRGVLFLTPHLGAFEIIAPWIASTWPLTVMYRQPKFAWLDPIVRAGRTRRGVELVTADLRGVRAMLRALRAGRAVGLLPDQAPGAGEGVWAEFFGRPAYTMTLASRLAQSTGATILMAVAWRLPQARGYHFEFHRLPEAIAADPQHAARAINAAVEALVRRCPEQYLWSYNRYKRPAGAPPRPPAPLHGDHAQLRGAHAPDDAQRADA